MVQQQSGVRLLPNYDKALRDFFDGSLTQVFLYITNRCGLRCEQCFYKSELNSVEMAPDLALFHARQCAMLGAKKITLLGGEPSLYDFTGKWRNLKTLVSALPSYGYEYIRIDTNGQFEGEFIAAVANLPITELSFSLDGGNAAQNDLLRGAGAFEQAARNIRECLKLFRVSVTTCVSKTNLATLAKDIDYLSGLGVAALNFHPLLRIGNGQDEYIKRSAITPEEWRSAYASLVKMREERKGLPLLRIPPRFAKHPLTTSERYCSLRIRDRIHIQPNGQIRICPLTVGTPYSTGRLVDHSLKLVDDAPEVGQLEKFRACAFQSIEGSFEPLCVSYKPC